MSNVIDFPTRCRHDVFRWKAVALSICPHDDSATWTEDGEEIDGAEAMAILFGNFDLTGCLECVGAPGAAVLAYTPGRHGKVRLEAFPPHRWLPGAPGLWFSHDGERLLLSPTDDRMTANLMR